MPSVRAILLLLLVAAFAWTTVEARTKTPSLSASASLRQNFPSSDRDWTLVICLCVILPCLLIIAILIYCCCCKKSDNAVEEVDGETEAVVITAAAVEKATPVEKAARAEKAVVERTVKAASAQPAVYDAKPQNGGTKFNINAIRGGSNEKDAKKDEFGNPIGDEFDLVRDGAMKGYKIIIGDFYGASGKHKELEEAFATDGVIRTVLERKGFHVDYFNKLLDFNAHLKPEEYHCAWIIASNGRKGPSTPYELRFLEKVLDFHLAGRGLFLLGDNDPWNAEVNDVLRLLKTGFEVEGNTPGNGAVMKRLGPGQTTLTQGTFCAHPITAGCRAMYDGNTICYPDKNFDAAVKAGRYEVIGVSQQWNTICMLASTDAAAAKGFGRVIVDCAFTKLFTEVFHSTPGTARYIANCSVIVSGAGDYAEFGPVDPDTGRCPLRSCNPTEKDLDAFAGASK